MNRIDQTIGELLGKLKAARGKLRRGKAEIASLREQLATAQQSAEPCRLCHCCLDAPDRHGEILGEWVERAESAERELAALKAQGCETCARQGLRLTPDIYCALHEDMAARFGNRCGRWTPAPPSGAGREEP